MRAMVLNPMPGLEDFSDQQLRDMPDVVVVYRRYVPWDLPLTCVAEEPVDLCRLSMIRFALPRLRLDACDLQSVSFTYRFVQAVSDEDMAALRARLSFEEEVHFAIRRVAKDFYTRE